MVIWNLVNLRAETRGVAYLNDSSVHEQMVRFATLQIRAGHLPLTSWFPYLGLGSPQFLHYQSLPAMLAGLLGLVTGPNEAFRWTLYILLSVWPVSIYLSARLFGAGRWAAAAAAAMAPFLVSPVGVGYEQGAYLWIGYGIWPQLWASLTLPLAWGLSWRAMREGRGFFPAVVAVSLTVALHFETGYLALMALLLWPLVSGTPIATRVRRAAVLISGSLLVSAWVIVPLIHERMWAATNEVLGRTSFVNGYGAPRVLGWVFSGQLLDHGRIPVVTLFAGVGLALACARWRRDPSSRALVVVLIACVLLSFGRTTYGVLADVIPGSRDLFFRRFMMGIELAALLLAGMGAGWCGAKARHLLDAVVTRWRKKRPALVTHRFVPAVVLSAAGILVLAPAWSQLRSYDQRNAAAVDTQVTAQKLRADELNGLIALAKRSGGGRIYAGMPSNWGMNFRIGAVPVFKYLESRDADEVGYTLRTASLMTNPEYHFDERNPSDYSLFGIRYLILPRGWGPPVPAGLNRCAGIYCLWITGPPSYVHVGRIIGKLTANRSDLGAVSIPLLRSPLPRVGAFLRVAFGGRAHTTQPLPAIPTTSSVGNVTTENSDLVQGRARATVNMRQAGIAVLSASFDPGWKVTVDDHPRTAFAVAPALVATEVPAGVHVVAYRYVGYSGYLALFVLCGVSLFAVAGLELRRRMASAARDTPSQ